MGNVYVLAGVPTIVSAMLQGLEGKLQGGRPMTSVTVSAHAAESEVAALLEQVQDEHPGVSIGSYPFFSDGGFGADFVIRSDNEVLAKICADDLRTRLDLAGVEVINRS
jgi:molybdopterin-biosynthesis enzyme MoeA-like protein